MHITVLKSAKTDKANLEFIALLLLQGPLVVITAVEVPNTSPANRFNLDIPVSRTQFLAAVTSSLTDPTPKR